MEFFSIPLTRVDDAEAYLSGLFDGPERRSIVTPNPEIFLLAREDGAFRDALTDATDRLPDGVGLYVGAMILDSGLPGWLDALLLPWYALRLVLGRAGLVRRYGRRMQGSDLTTRLLERAAAEGRTVAVIDRDAEDWPEKARMQALAPALLEKKFAGIKIRYEIMGRGAPDWAAVGQRLDDADVTIALCALGMKTQEVALRPLLDHARRLKIAAGIGSSIDYHTGFQKRAPEAFRRAGMEWFYRIFTDKRKLARIKRIFDAVVRFPLAVAASKKSPIGARSR